MLVKRKRKLCLLALIVMLHFALDYFGIYLFFRQEDFYTKFSYPLEGNILELATQLKKGETPSRKPVYNHDYLFYQRPSRCLSSDESHYEQLRLVYIVKSAMSHFDKRETIRRTWGYERRFSDVPIRTVFLLGSSPSDPAVQGQVEIESRKYADIVQGSFVDAYFNNSIKTMMGLRWAVEMCPTARFYMFVDDDYYVSTKNVLRFLRNPVNYPKYLEEDVISFDDGPQEHVGRRGLAARHLNQLVDFDLPPDVRLYTGYVLDGARPMRHRSSTWFIDLDEYPFHLYPPYVTAGAYVLSRNAIIDMYYCSYFTKLFRFDDIYLSLIARKAELEPLHSSEFYFWPKRYSVPGFRYVVASHGFSDPRYLQRVWNEQKQAGNA